MLLPGFASPALLLKLVFCVFLEDADKDVDRDRAEDRSALRHNDWNSL